MVKISIGRSGTGMVRGIILPEKEEVVNEGSENDHFDVEQLDKLKFNNGED